MAGIFVKNEKTGEDNSPDLPENEQCIYGVKTIFTDGSEAFDLHIVDNYSGSAAAQVSVAFDDEDALSAAVDAFDTGINPGLAEVLEP